MSALNKVQIIGNVGQDPEVRYMPNGNAVANMTIATGEKWKDKNTGEQKEETEWHRVVVFGKLAEIIGEYVRKGSKLFIEGKLKTRKWTDQQGQEKYTTEIIVDGFSGQMIMLDGKPQGAQGNQQQQPKQQQQGVYNQPQQGGYGQQQAPQQQNQHQGQHQAPHGGYQGQQAPQQGYQHK